MKESGRDILPGDVVLSVRGRDMNRQMLVLEVKDGFVSVCDGRIRRTEKPKRKKAAHVRWQARPQGEGWLGRVSEKIRAGGKVTNSELRRALNEYSAPDGAPGRDANVEG
ncbi:MAG: RNA-binding protein [Oscillospiraceae bacterium]|jgi:hypothetical protein|nr:RNA-binding protein [Oscillospiraceae bacterium]